MFELVIIVEENMLKKNSVMNFLIQFSYFFWPNIVHRSLTRYPPLLLSFSKQFRGTSYKSWLLGVQYYFHDKSWKAFSWPILKSSSQKDEEDIISLHARIIVLFFSLSNSDPLCLFRHISTRFLISIYPFYQDPLW